MAVSPSYTASFQPLVVLDKNQLRGANAAAAIAQAKSSKCQILVTDTVLVEIAREADWKDQFEKDFRDWTADADLLSVSNGLGELLRLERDRGTAALSSLVDGETTDFFRSAVRELAASGKAGLAKFDARMAAAAARLRAPGAMLDPAENLSQLQNMLDVWWQHGIWWSEDKEAAKAAVRKEVQDRAVVACEALGIAVTSDGVLAGIEDALVLVGYDRSVAKQLLSAPSFTLLVWTAREALSLYYYSQGRKPGDFKDAEREINQTLDTHYLGYGLACQQLITAEKMVRRLDGGMRRALAARWP